MFRKEVMLVVNDAKGQLLARYRHFVNRIDSK